MSANRIRKDRGAALLIVILIIGLLAVLVVEFQREARTELRAAANLRDTLQGHALSRSGVAVAQVLLLQDLEDPRHSRYDGRDEDWNLTKFPIPIESPGGTMNGTVELLEDLNGKFPVGALVNEQGQPQNRYLEAYQRFLEALDIHLQEVAQIDILSRVEPIDLVDALVDWIDADADGAFESNPDYTVPNTPLLHLENLQRVEGYGLIPDGYAHSVADAVIPYLDTRNVAQVNVNTAEPPVLTALHPEMGYDDAVRLYEELTAEPATDKFQPQHYDSTAHLKLTEFVLDHTVVSTRFRLRLTVDVRGVQHRAEAVLVRNKAERDVETAAWREGWMRAAWRPAFAAEPSLPGFTEGFLQ